MDRFVVSPIRRMFIDLGFEIVDITKAQSYINTVNKVYCLETLKGWKSNPF